MKLPTSQLYVVVSPGDGYSAASIFTDGVYTDKAEADAKAAELNSQVYLGMSLKLSVMTLDELISEVKNDSYQLGQHAERDAAAYDNP